MPSLAVDPLLASEQYFSLYLVSYEEESKTFLKTKLAHLFPVLSFPLVSGVERDNIPLVGEHASLYTYKN